MKGIVYNATKVHSYIEVPVTAFVSRAISPSFTTSHPDVLHPVHVMARISSCVTTSIDEKFENN
ncbi:Hypothetical predicted protein [Paramuricea clavata]|uniref:Uncharacterized protein n=1 Tax=Paramuricea clavata TaxID=317549 RepID=A0A6S7IR73_PARCT|nr:Hypothetical predicted protein [Paramuricea clavata]